MYILIQRLEVLCRIKTFFRHSVTMAEICNFLIIKNRTEMYHLLDTQVITTLEKKSKCKNERRNKISTNDTPFLYAMT